MDRIIYISWAALFLAILALGGVVYGASVLEAEAYTRAQAASDQAHQSDSEAYAQRIHAVAVDTVNERASLDSFAHLDVVQSVQLLEDTGTSVGASATVTDATPESGGTQLSNGEILKTISFSIAADGTYTSLMRTVQLYEHLPLASRIVQFDIDHSGVDPKRPWHMTARIRVVAITQSL